MPLIQLSSVKFKHAFAKLAKCWNIELISVCDLKSIIQYSETLDFPRLPNRIRHDFVWYNCDKQINITEQTVPDWKKADIIGAKNFLYSINWNNMLPTNTSDAWDYLKSVIAEINQRFIPEKKRRNPNKPLWLN